MNISASRKETRFEEKTTLARPGGPSPSPRRDDRTRAHALAAGVSAARHRGAPSRRTARPAERRVPPTCTNRRWRRSRSSTPMRLSRTQARPRRGFGPDRHPRARPPGSHAGRASSRRRCVAADRHLATLRHHPRPAGAAVVAREARADGTVRRAYAGNWSTITLASAADLLAHWWSELRRCAYPPCSVLFLPEEGPRQKYHDRKCSALIRYYRLPKVKRNYKQELVNANIREKLKKTTNKKKGTS